MSLVLFRRSVCLVLWRVAGFFSEQNNFTHTTSFKFPTAQPNFNPKLKCFENLTSNQPTIVPRKTFFFHQPTFDERVKTLEKVFEYVFLNSSFKTTRTEISRRIKFRFCSKVGGENWKDFFSSSRVSKFFGRNSILLQKFGKVIWSISNFLSESRSRILLP